MDAAESLRKFTEYTIPHWRPGRIHREICAQLDRVARKEIDRLMLLCPPQHGKSTAASKRFPAYLLGRNPATDVISASATAQLAEEFGRDVRNCIASPDYRNVFPGVELAEDSQAKGRWNTSAGGGYYAVGIGGALMGRGAELALVDDPFATWEDGQSQLSRERAWDWYTGTLYNRVRPGGAIVVIQHRMHEDDLVGRLLAQQAAGGDTWAVVELPADLDNPPWAERYDRAALERIKANTSPLKWSALYMQRPMPEEGTFFKREWFRFYDPHKLPPVRKYLTSDFAVTEKQTADYTEIGIHGVAQEDGRAVIYAGVDGWYGQAESTRWTEEYIALCARHKPLSEFGEAGVIQRAIEPWLNRRRMERKAFGRIEWLPSINDKPARAQALRSMASMGLVRLPGNDYGHRLLSQLLGFPGAKHDDAVDMIGLLARAMDMAHPALAATPATPIRRDRYERDQEASSWRV